MIERRSATPRRRTLKPDTIAFSDGGAIDGVVKNLSDTGALLQVESVIGIPDTFTLYIKRECQIIRRRQNKIGVSFL
jgi:hypothetical protein